MNFRFSGHETFPFRYAWLPKAYKALSANPLAFTNESEAMVNLGVGKNMVRAMRFWIQVTGIAEPRAGGGYVITDFGRALLKSNGFDPYLEDIKTLWLLHWKLSTHVEEPLFAWHYILNNWHSPELSRFEILNAFEIEARKQNRELSKVTLEQHFDIFLHSYVPRNTRKGDLQEDNLDCPLIELELIQQIGERKLGELGRHEPIYIFRREPKPEITATLFAFCLHDFWIKRRSTEMTLSFRDIASAEGSLGQIFKLPEWDLRERLDTLEKDTGGIFLYKETSTLQQIVQTGKMQPQMLSHKLFSSIYQAEVTSV